MDETGELLSELNCGCKLRVHFRVNLEKNPWQLRRPVLCEFHKDIHRKAQKLLRKTRKKLSDLVKNGP